MVNGSMDDQTANLVTIPEGYVDWLTEISSRISVTQQRAMLAVNREIERLYWQIGQDILTRQAQQGWGLK